MSTINPKTSGGRLPTHGMFANPAPRRLLNADGSYATPAAPEALKASLRMIGSDMAASPCAALPPVPWVTDAEEDIVTTLRDARRAFKRLPSVDKRDADAFEDGIDELEKLVVMRLARRTAATPLCPGDIVDTDDIELELRWLAASEARERREAHLTYYLIAAVAVCAACGAALRFLGVGA